MKNINKKVKLKMCITLAVTVLTLTTGVEKAYAVARYAEWQMDGWWWLDDDPSAPDAENNTGYGAGDSAQETNITDVPKQTNVRFRGEVSETNNQNQGESLEAQLEYSVGDNTCTAAVTWYTVTTSSTEFQLVNTSNITDGTGPTTDRITGQQRTHDTTSGQLLDQTNPAASHVIAQLSGEWEWNLQATTSASDSQTYTFRLTDGGNALTAYPLPTANDCPTLTTASAATTTYNHNDFEWFVTTNSVTLTNAWPPGSGENLGENEIFTQIPATNDPLENGDQIRVQMNFTITGAALSATTQAFKFQYKATETCDTSPSWLDVGSTASGSIWRLFDETGIGPSTAQVNDISTSTGGAEGYYSEINASGTNPNAVGVGESSEWDWPLENNGATENTTYCFRMVLSDDTLFNSYPSDSYPKLTTAPGINSLMRHGNIFQNDSEKGFFWAN